MADITAGTLLANRYRLISRAESDLADVNAWQATDQILDRPVRVALVSGPHATDALDDARRAALVSDPRIVRVIDAGTADGVQYVVLEEFIGDDLSVLTSGRALSADQAKAIVGEAASALEVARQRGVHHLALRPQAVRVLNGRVQVTGLGLDGTLNPGARGASATSARADVVGLLSVFFYATSGSWPLSNLEAINTTSGTLLPETAQPSDGKTLSLADFATDVPAELVELVDRTLFSKTGGPRTPGELVAELEPWGQVTATPPRMFDSVHSESTESRSQQGSFDQVKAEVAGQPALPTGNHAEATSDAEQSSAAKNGQQDPIVRQSIRPTLSSEPTRAPLPGTPPPAVPTTEPGRVRRQSVLSGPTLSAPPSAPAPAPNAGSTPSSNGLAPNNMPPAWAPVSQSNASQTTPDLPLSDAQSPLKFDELVSAPREYRRFRFNPTALTLVLALVVVVVGVPMALTNLTSGLTNPFADKEIVRPLPPGETATEDEEEPEASTPPAETTKPPIAPVIASGQQLDPQGDDNEHPEAVDLAFDQDPSTYWFTRTYQSTSFAGMGKDGIGFAVMLEEAAPVSTVYLSTNNSGGNVEVRATDPKNPTKGKVLASGPMEDELTLELSETVETEHIVLWFTELPSTSEGNNRVELREITLT